MKANIIVPDHLKEITLKQYQKFVKLQDKNEGTFFLQQKMVEIFCGIKATDVLKIQYNDVDRITTVLNDMFDSKPDLVHRFVLDGVEYGFTPSLNKLSFGEYIDLDTYMGDWQNIHIAMNVLYRPIKQELGDKYLIKEYTTEGKDKLLSMPMDAVLGSIFFFFNLGKDCAANILNYLDKDQEILQAQELDLGKNGGGINHFLHSLEEILQDLKISQN
tara:strand:- start:17407 stop:18057 length:651 start_codon:yes stop_codon:yes gene_type:complete